MTAIKVVSCAFVLFVMKTCIALNKTTIPVNVGVVLDAETWTGRMGLSCIKMALSDLYVSNDYYKTRLVLNTKDSKTDVIGAALAGLDLVKNFGVKAIIGPITSMQANFVINLGEKVRVPILTFSATSPSLTSLGSPYFFRVTQNDIGQVKAISAIVQAFRWKEAVPLYIDNEYGEGVIPFLTSALQDVGTLVPYLSVFPSSATDDQIAQELDKLKKMKTRVFIVHMTFSLGSRLFTKAKQIGMMNQGYVWIMTNGLTDIINFMNSSVLESMQGVLGVRTYVPKTEELEDFEVRWKRQFQMHNPTIINPEMNVLGLWAYDAATALAMAVEKAAASTDIAFQMTNASSNITDIETLEVSQNGEKLREALSSTRFRGLTGDFDLVNGQLQPSTFHIININSNGIRGIGFWTTQDGLIRNLSSRNRDTYSTSQNNLGSIIWPGDTILVPKGWEILTDKEKFRVGVPLKRGFFEFVNTKYDPPTKTQSVSGYSIDLFKAVTEALPYALQYEFIVFQPDVKNSDYYGQLLRQVYFGVFDAVVGDITISASRSLYVDFTFPYTENGATFIVPTKDENKTNAWIFLKPLTWKLWITSGCFFVFVGFVVWVLEHRSNEDFQGSPSHQVGTTFWFSFSTLFFAQRVRVHSNLARFVVIIWVFVVLILTQSYTASLTSFLTVQQLRPTFSNVDDLLRNGAVVGYQRGSFTREILRQIGFADFQLKAYDSPEECDHLLTLGTGNGGIAAAFDEMPYIDLFQASYCSKYTTMGPTIKTNGFGFAFPRNSPLVPDFSRAILSVTERDKEKVNSITNKWFKNNTRCLSPSTVNTSYSIDLDSFRGLFLVAGIASSSALILYLAMFLYRHRQVLRKFDPQDSLWKRICVLFRIFHQKDLTLYASRKIGGQIHADLNKVHDIGLNEASLEICCITSPSRNLNHSDSNSSFSKEQEMFSAEFGNANLNSLASGSGDNSSHEASM
ncbi:Glutamate receptor [Quillaja saponaria]|uniref:Glutamate receptor n=1 Tax=Quillaja saponaria TaxID=32244 RepID=A0AAD7LI92_QUISA|nr:Glutamate receptor [Quillaja saponaria]